MLIWMKLNAALSLNTSASIFVFICAVKSRRQLVIFVVKKHWLLTNTEIWQVVHYSICYKCPPPPFTQIQSLFWELNVAFVDQVHVSCTSVLSSSMFCSLGWSVAFKHSSPDMVVQRAEIRRLWRPFIFTNELAVFGCNSVFSQYVNIWDFGENENNLFKKFRKL